jgi:hypothetical protein
MNTCIHNTAMYTYCQNIAALAGALTLLIATGCANTAPAPVPLDLERQLLVFDALTGEHRLLEAGTAQAAALLAAHPARLERMPQPDRNVAQLNNVSIPRRLGAETGPSTPTPSSPSATKELRP